MYYLLVAALLYGSAQVDNHRGRIGIEDEPGIHRTCTIVHVHKDSVASKAGLKKGDKIIYYDDDDIIGPVGTEVTLIVKRGKRIFVVTIVRMPVEDVNKAYED